MAKNKVFTSLIVAALAASSLADDGQNNLGGVRPEDVQKYSSNVFVCDDGAITLDSKALNDDFCDCKDKSDEPGTNACGGSFFCQNPGHISKTISDSFVNDGLCDCCDASDEYGTGACENTCEVLAQAYKEEMRGIWEMHKKAFEIKKEMLASGKETIDKDQTRMDEIRQEIDLKKADLVKDEELFENARAAAKVETDKEDQEHTEKLEREEEQARLALEKEAAENPEENAQPEQPKEEVKEDDKNNNNDEEDEDDDFGDEDEDDDFGEEFDEDDSEPGDRAPPVRRPSVVYTEATQKLVDAKNDAQKKVRTIESELRKIEKELKELQDSQDYDFGPNGIFRSLAKTCFDNDAGNFKYTLCLFDKVDQNPGRINIGRKFSWTPENGDEAAPVDYNTMYYTGGNSCWQGPTRATTVHLHCDVENRIGKVTEPQKCIYEMDFYTPAACPDPEVEGHHDEL